MVFGKDQNVKGENNPMYGKHPTPWNKGLKNVNGNCGAPKGTVAHNKGKHTKINTRIKQSLAKTGEKKFKGFKSSIKILIRQLIEYKEWRLMIFGRDNFTCQDCNKRGIYLEAHHIISFKSIINNNNIQTIETARACKKLWDIKNGITYCKPCHIKNDLCRGGQRKLN